MIVQTTPIILEGIAAVISQNIVPVEKYCEGLASPKKLDKLISSSGFKSLSIADDDVCASDMCFQAAENLFSNGFNKENIGAIFFISQNPDYARPATAYVLQNRLGLSSDSIVFDMNIGCSGFVNGLYMASSILNSLNGKKVLICCGSSNPRSSKAVDTNSGSLIGDAGACAIVSKSSETAPLIFNLASFGKYWNTILLKRGGTRYYKDILAGRAQPESPDYLGYMNGLQVAQFVLYEVAHNIQELVEFTKINVEDVGACFLHQANMFLLSNLIEKLGWSHDKFVTGAENIGNTEVTSIPLLFTEIGENWSKRPNKKVLMSGFGTGLAVASTIINLDNLICLRTKKYERSDV